jgi:hypothetical protein
MSVSNTTSKAGPYSANGAQILFPFGFKAFSKNDLRVVLTDGSGNESDLTVDSQFTVSLNADQNASPGGSITTVATYAAGYLVTVVSNLTPNQLVSLTNFRPDVVEKALDKLTLLVQQLFEQTSRAVKTSVSSTISADALLASIISSVASASASATAAGNSATAAAGSATAANNSAIAAAASAVTAAGYVVPSQTGNGGKFLKTDGVAVSWQAAASAGANNDITSMTGLANGGIPLVKVSGAAGSGAVTGSGITMSTAKILGRSTAATGAIEEITVGAGLTLSAGTLVGSVVTQLITDSTDIAVGSFITPAYSNVGSSFSANIPANGIIRLASFACRLLNDATAAVHTLNLGIRIGTINYWFGYVNFNGTGVAGNVLQGGNTANAFTEFNGTPANTTGAPNAASAIDVAAMSIPSGVQTVQLIAAWTTTACTLKGTVKQTRVCLEIEG